MPDHSMPTGLELETQLADLEERMNAVSRTVTVLAERLDQSETGVDAADYGRLRTTMLELRAVAQDEILARATAVLDGLDEAHFSAWRAHAAR